MIDLTITESEKKESGVESILNKPKYPHGMKLYIDKETYRKLGCEGKPEIGKVLKLLAVAEVVNVSSEKMFGDDSNYSMELQITSMEIDKPAEKESAESMLYGPGSR